MNKLKVIVIASLMAFALVGLIALQINWFRHDYEMRQEKFNHLATESINKVIGKLETRQSVHFLSREMDGLIDDSVAGYFRRVELPEIPELPEVLVNIDTTIDESEVELQHASASVHNNKSIVKIVSKKRNGSEEVKISVTSPESFKDSEENEVRIAGLELAAAKAEMQNAKMQAQIDLEKAAQNRELKKVSEKAKAKAEQLNAVIQKMTFEYEQRDFNLMKRLSPSAVDSLIGKEFKNNGIYLPYSIAFNSGKNDSIVWQRNTDVPLTHGSNSIKAKLFPNDIVNRTEFITVNFPDTLMHFLSSMWMMLLSSVLFTGIIIFAFTYTVIVIFRQKKLSEVKNDFINNMTHEFKTPIATIRLAVEAISNPGVISDSEKVKYYSGIIKDENERMNSHVENILQIAQFDKQAFAPSLEPVNIHNVINDAISMMQLHLEQKQGVISFNANAINSVISADKRFIPLVFLNLIDNAIKYSDKAPDIIIETQNENNTLIISITDKGIGMSSDKQRKIFDKFYRVTTGDLHNVKGFGLGLSYVKAIVTAHNGSVTVNSELGEGTTFTIKFPTL